MTTGMMAGMMMARNPIGSAILPVVLGIDARFAKSPFSHECVKKGSEQKGEKDDGEGSGLWNARGRGISRMDIRAYGEEVLLLFAWLQAIV